MTFKILMARQLHFLAAAVENWARITQSNAAVFEEAEVERIVCVPGLG
jgi:hypothetical protein